MLSVRVSFSPLPLSKSSFLGVGCLARSFCYASLSRFLVLVSLRLSGVFVLVFVFAESVLIDLICAYSLLPVATTTSVLVTVCTTLTNVSFSLFQLCFALLHLLTIDRPDFTLESSG